MPKSGGICTQVPDRGGEGVGEGIFCKAFTPYGLRISVLTHGGWSGEGKKRKTVEARTSARAREIFHCSRPSP